MHIASLADRTISIFQRTASVRDAMTAATSMPVNRQPARASALRVTVAGGTTGSGTVTIVGTVEGVTGVSEVLTFTANGTKVTSKLFTAISSIATANLSSEPTVPTVAIEAVDQGGAPQAQDVLRVAGVPAQLKRNSARWPVPVTGSETVQKITYIVDYSDVWTPRKGDKIIEDANTSEVSIIEEARQPGGSWFGSHFELTATRV